MFLQMLTYLASLCVLIGFRALADCGGGRGLWLGEEVVDVLTEAAAFLRIASRMAEALVCAWAICTWKINHILFVFDNNEKHKT